MNKKETIEFLAEHGIHQLRKGESLNDAINSVKNNKGRVGYEYLDRYGNPLDDNQIAMAANKEAFMKFTPKEYVHDEVEDIDDICDSEDFREDKSDRGIIINCFYCGTALRIDAGVEVEDYPPTDPLIHCDGCMRDAIANNAM